MQRLIPFTINLAIYIFALLLERRRKEGTRWYWVFYFTNNIVWSLFAVLGTIYDFYPANTGSYWFPLTQLQFLVTFLIDRYLLIPREFSRAIGVTRHNG